MDSSPSPDSPSSPTPPSLPSNSSSPPSPSLPQPPPSPSMPSLPPPQPSPSSPPPATSNSTTSPPPATSPPPSASPPPVSAPPPSPPVSPPSEAKPLPPPPSSDLNPPSSPPKDNPSPIRPPSPSPPKTSNPPTSSSPLPPQPNNSPPIIQPPSDSSPITLSPPPPSEASDFPPPPTSLTPPSNGTASSLSPPTASSTTSRSPTSSSLTVMSLVIGVAIGVGLLLIVLLVWFIFSCIKKNKKRQEEMDHFDDGSRAGKSFYDSSHNSYSSWRNAQQPAADQVIQIPPPPRAVVSTLPSGWPTPPPPPTSSTEGNSNSPSTHEPDSSITLGFNKSTFTYNELAAATNGFAFDTIIGQGGFGYVHKGVLPNGQEVAVKCLKAGSGQGDREFQAEVEIISRVHHRHLVSLVGYCIAGNQRMLVYEFLPNKTLEYHLHGRGRPPIGWSTRLLIALGSAKGIAYLHEDCHPRIIHRDIKAANILLDFNFEVKVADFGLAKLTSDNSTHVSTRIMGTFGYLAPEYAASGKLTDKSDVFSFGVMLLELITGRRPVDPTGVLMEDSLVDWARPRIGRALEESNFNELADPRLEASYVHHEMMRLVACAGACIRHSARGRPKMSQIVRVLEGDGSLDILNDWSKSMAQSSAGQSSTTVGQSSAGQSSTTDYETVSYSENMRRFKKVTFNSQEYVSSEYGGTSEYGLNPSSSSSDSEETSKVSSRRRSP